MDYLINITVIVTLKCWDNLKEMKESSLCPCSYKSQLVLKFKLSNVIKAEKHYFINFFPIRNHFLKIILNPY